MAGLIGKKLGMTRVIQADGSIVPVTVISVPHSTVVQLKTEEKDGYNAVVLGFDPLKKPTKTKKYRTLKEFRFENQEEIEQGKEVGINILEEVEKITISSISKGRGFAGVIKRWNFSRGPETHGSKHHRRPGSIGQCAKPGRVMKGKKLPGRMGTDKITLKNRQLVKIDKEKNLIAVKGPVPGPNGNTIFISF